MKRNYLKRKYWPTILFTCYLAVLLRITVFRSGFGTHGLCSDGQINLKLFEAYIPLIRTRDWDRFAYLFIGNLIWFVPLGMYVRYRKAGRGDRGDAVSLRNRDLGAGRSGPEYRRRSAGSAVCAYSVHSDPAGGAVICHIHG